MTCLQAPQGGINWSLSVAMAIALNFLIPPEMALKSAVRSAQIVRLKELFSILEPVMIFPDEVRSAAPTLKFENGEWEYCFAFCAALTRLSYFTMTFRVYEAGKIYGKWG